MPMMFHFEFPFSQIPPPLHTEYYWGYSFLAMLLYFYNFSSFLWRKKQDKKGEEADGAGGGNFVFQWKWFKLFESTVNQRDGDKYSSKFGNMTVKNSLEMFDL